MRKLALIVALALPLALAAAPASSLPKHAVRLHMHRDSDGNRWRAWGWFKDGGTFVDDVVSTPTSVDGRRTFTGNKGSFVVHVHARIVATDDPGIFNVKGRWRALSGSYLYERMRGHGRIHETFTADPFLVVGTWKGWIWTPCINTVKCQA